MIKDTGIAPKDLLLPELMPPISIRTIKQQRKPIRGAGNELSRPMDAVLSGGRIKEIIRVLVKSVENPVIVKDLYFGEYINDEHEYQEEYKMLIKYDINALRTTRKNFYHKKIVDQVVVNNECVNRVVIPIYTQAKARGHMVIYGTNRRITDIDVQTMESLTNIVALEFLRRSSVQEAENKYQEEFFNDLISDDKNRKQKAIEYAHFFKLSTENSHAIISISIKKISPDNHSNKFSNALGIQYQVEMLFKNQKNAYLLANNKDDIYILLQCNDTHEDHQEIYRIAEVILQLFKKYENKIDVRIGIGRARRGLSEVSCSFRDAQKAVEYSRSNMAEQIVEFDKLGIYKIFCQDHMENELLDFYHSTIKVLVDYDRKRGGELVKTLQAYFETNGNLSKMSKMLFTHYNTCSFRIRRIQEVTGMNLNCEEDHYRLHTALKIMNMLKL